MVPSSFPKRYVRRMKINLTISGKCVVCLFARGRRIVSRLWIEYVMKCHFITQGRPYNFGVIGETKFGGPYHIITAGRYPHLPAVISYTKKINTLACKRIFGKCVVFVFCKHKQCFCEIRSWSPLLYMLGCTVKKFALVWPFACEVKTHF